MFDVFCALLITANGYMLECHSLKRKLDYYEYCEPMTRYMKTTKYAINVMNGEWFGQYCTTKEEMKTWKSNKDIEVKLNEYE